MQSKIKKERISLFFLFNCIFIDSKISIVSKMRTERKLSEEHKRKISESMKGKCKSEITKNKISESMKKYWEEIPYEKK